MPLHLDLLLLWVSLLPFTTFIYWLLIIQHLFLQLLLTLLLCHCLYYWVKCAFSCHGICLIQFHFGYLVFPLLFHYFLSFPTLVTTLTCLSFRLLPSFISPVSCFPVSSAFLYVSLILSVCLCRCPLFGFYLALISPLDCFFCRTLVFGVPCSPLQRVFFIVSLIQSPFASCFCLFVCCLGLPLLPATALSLQRPLVQM